MHVELVSPERILFSGEAEMVICRAADGEIAFLENHAPFLGALDVGVVKIQVAGGAEVRAAVHGGFVEVRDNRVILLSDVAEMPDHIDVERARQSKAAAEEELRKSDPEDWAAPALRSAEIRLELAGAA